MHTRTHTQTPPPLTPTPTPPLQPQVAGALETVASQSGPEVQLGSYPLSDQVDGAGIVLSLESTSEGELESAAAALRALLPPGSLLADQADGFALSSPKSPPMLPPPPR